MKLWVYFGVALVTSCVAVYINAQINPIDSGDKAGIAWLATVPPVITGGLLAGYFFHRFQTERR